MGIVCRTFDLQAEALRSQSHSVWRLRAMRLCVLSVLGTLALFCEQVANGAERPAKDAQESTEARGLGVFNDYVLPMLKEHCLDCHSHAAGESEGGLVLDSRAGWMTGGSLGPAIVPGRPEQSWLYKAVRYGDGKLKMPPDGKLSERNIKHVREWISLGAPDPRKGVTGRSVASGTPRSSDLWSVQPLSDARLPEISETLWGKARADRFIRQSLTKAGLEPSKDAPPHVLLNRLHYVLTGLPPTPRGAEEFMADAAENLDAALAKKVDQLLKSAEFGVRWGRHWLDVARYADSPGTTNPRPYTESWRYRNYVIDAFRKDKPFDRFVREQLAGDLLPHDSSEERVENLIATGFISLGHVPGADRDIEKLTLDRIDEQLDVIGTTFLGIRIGCARCHDHKLDPFPTRDYYAMAGIFRSTQAGPARRMGPGLRDAGLLPAVNGRSPQWMKATAKTRFHGAIEGAAMRDEPIHLRGDVELHGDVIPRGLPSLVGLTEPVVIPDEHSGRRQLAEWLLSPDNPLVMRVIVNRVWHHVFGQGLVRTTDNFGFTGDQPSHPELLDDLARRFRDEHQFSFKSLIRELVLSRTWRQSSDVRREAMDIDPNNQLLWRSNMRRADAESLVDSIRFVAGQLDRTGAARTVPNFNVGNQGTTSDLEIDPAVLRKRAIYWPVFRKDVPVSMDVLGIFDFPSATAPRGTREVTRVPAQSLSLMNSPLVIRAARGMTRQMQEIRGDDAERLRQLYMKLFARAPEPSEVDRCLQFLDRFTSELNTEKAAKPENSRSVAWNRLCHSLLVCNEFLVIE